MTAFARDPHAIKTMPAGALVEEFRPLVGSIVNKLRRQLRLSVSPEDLEAYGFEGLLEAQTRFDPEAGTFFASFAYYRIRGSVLDGCRREGWLGVRLRDERRARATDELLETTGATERATPPPASLGEALDRVTNVVDCLAVVFLLNGEDFDRVQATEPTQYDRVQRRSEQRLVHAALDVLTDVEREVVQRYYFEGESMEEIAALLGHSKSWVSRVNTRALEKMKDHILNQEQA